jgi:hypothetical protein
VNGDGSVDGGGSVARCASVEVNGCTTRGAGCPFVMANSASCTSAYSITFGAGGSSVSGTASITCTGALTCTGNYDVVGARQ